MGILGRLAGVLRRFLGLESRTRAEATLPPRVPLPGTVRPEPPVLGREEEHQEPSGRDFARVLDPVDPWLEPAGEEARAQAFRGRHDPMSVAALASCSPALVLASFYGPASYQMPVEPYYFRFTDREAERDGGRLDASPSDPPWPPEYSEAHHDLIGDQPAIARSMTARHDADPRRAVPVSRLDVLRGIASLLARPDVHEEFRKKGWKRLRGLLKLRVDREEVWVPLALDYAHILDDPPTQTEFRKLYNNNRQEWNDVAGRVPRVAEDPQFSRPRTPQSVAREPGH